VLLTTLLEARMSDDPSPRSEKFVGTRVRTIHLLLVNNWLTNINNATTAPQVLPLICVQLVMSIPPIITAVDNLRCVYCWAANFSSVITSISFIVVNRV
jgi:hypothetical protein